MDDEECEWKTIWSGDNLFVLFNSYVFKLFKVKIEDTFLIKDNYVQWPDNHQYLSNGDAKYVDLGSSWRNEGWVLYSNTSPQLAAILENLERDWNLNFKAKDKLIYELKKFASGDTHPITKNK